MQFLGDIKQALLLNDDLRSLFGIKHFEKESESDIIVRMDDGHRFRIIAKGSEQRIRGSKWDGKRPDLIIGDDLENDEIVMNELRREKFRNWMVKAVLPSRDPRGKVRIVGTILHLDSFLSRVVPLEGFRNSKTEGFKTSQINQHSVWKGFLYRAHLGNTPYEIGTPKDILWPSRFTKEHFIQEYEGARDVGLQDGYFQEYLNKPIDDSLAVFRKGDFVEASQEELTLIATGQKPLLYYCGVDLAITADRKSDYSVFQVVGLDSEGMMYHIDCIRQRLDGMQIVNQMLALQNRYKLQWMAIEQEQIAKTLLAYVQDAMLRTGTFINVIPISGHSDKRAKASGMVARMRAKGVRFDKGKEFYPEMEAEFLAFDRGIKDDQVDALSMIGLAINKMNTALTYDQIVEDQIADEEKEHMIGTDGRSQLTGY